MKDLADALLMLSCIILVLTGTSDFENDSFKTPFMICLAVVAVGSIVLRVVAGKKNDHGNV